jgi:hypothetical protein
MNNEDDPDEGHWDLLGVFVIVILHVNTKV